MIRLPGFIDDVSAKDRLNYLASLRIFVVFFIIVIINVVVFFSFVFFVLINFFVVIITISKCEANKLISFLDGKLIRWNISIKLRY